MIRYTKGIATDTDQFKSGYPQRQTRPTHCTESTPLSLHILPKVIRIKEPRELGIDINHMDVALATVPDDGLVVVARLVRLDIDTQGPVELQSKSAQRQQESYHENNPNAGSIHSRILGFPFPSCSLVTLQPLSLQLRKPFLEHLKLALQPFGLNLQLGRGLGDAELFRVQSNHLRRVF